MKPIFSLIFLLVSFHAYSQDLSGRWVWDKNSHNHTFSISLKKTNEVYTGAYCAVALNGNRIDCSPDKYANKFTLNLKKTEFEFTSNYSRAKGIARIIVVGNKLKWEVIKRPNGMYFAPANAYLSRHKSLRKHTKQ